jgi:MFS family permease
MPQPPLPRTVRTLGAVSLLTDASSEMIYPLLPSFLATTLRAGPAFLGLVEGAAETTASLVKLVAGRLSDRLPRRKPLIVAGYGLSSLVRPLVALASAPVQVLAIRVTDRIGKGIRSAPRDALIAEVTPPESLGRAYGFHRALDHAGAVIGPLLASALLYFHHDLRAVFAWAAIPALLSVALLVFGVREAGRRVEPSQATPDSTTGRASAAVGEAPATPPPLRRYLAVLALFTLGNSSDAFLLLRAQELGLALPLLPLLWSAHHVVKSTLSTAGGRLSDRWGRRPTIIAGWGVYALAYAGFALAHAPWQAWALFALYGLFHALTEGPEKALVAELSAKDSRGHAFGLFHAITGGMLLPASLLTGALWQMAGPATALGIGAGLAGLAALGLWWLVPEPRS